MREARLTVENRHPAWSGVYGCFCVWVSRGRDPHMVEHRVYCLADKLPGNICGRQNGLLGDGAALMWDQG